MLLDRQGNLQNSKKEEENEKKGNDEEVAPKFYFTREVTEGEN